MTAQTNDSNDAHDNKKLYTLMLAAIGVVFGDIGTSPLYALKEAFSNEHGIPLSSDGILGILSMLCWSMIIVVSIKYVLFIMRADNQGEGGILALTALALRSKYKDKPNKAKQLNWILLCGIFGACMFYGDAMITPAISILSAVEGLGVVNPDLSQYILPIAISILLVLFFIQSKGTHVLGYLFGPITLVWFLSIGAIGFYNILDNPSILRAINPIYAIDFFIMHAGQALIVLGSVFLVLTGAEALYIDMGHFGAKPIKRAWFIVVMPCLMLNYFGQGAFLSLNPQGSSNPFYLMVPEQLTVAMVILATLATVVASQAVISGAFSLTSQAIQLGYLPRMTIKQTSSKERGQIYIPLINWMLLVIVCIVILIFKSSANLAAAYGIAVTTTMSMTTLLAVVVMRYLWKWKTWMVACFAFVFGILDSLFLIANGLKIMQGGWVPLVVGLALSFLIIIWFKGKHLLRENSLKDGLRLKDFLNVLMLSPPHRVEGNAVFLCSESDYVPAAFLHNLKHNRILHQTTLFIHLQTLDTPKVAEENRMHLEYLDNGLYQVSVDFGFMETPNLIEVLANIEKATNLQLDVMETSYFLGRESVVPSKLPGMPIWQEHVFAWMHRNAAKPSDFFHIPPNRIVELGTKVEI